MVVFLLPVMIPLLLSHDICLFAPTYISGLSHSPKKKGLILFNGTLSANYRHPTEIS